MIMNHLKIRGMILQVVDYESKPWYPHGTLR